MKAAAFTFGVPATGVWSSAIYDPSDGSVKTPAGVATDGFFFDNSGNWYVYAGKTFNLGEGANIVVGGTTGTQIGTLATQKLALWGKTPVVQPSGADQAVAAYTTQAISNPPTQAEVQNINDGLVTAVRLANALRTALVDAGGIKGSA